MIIDYKPRLQVLFVENDYEIADELVKDLVNQNIYTHHVDNLDDALEIIENCEIDFILSDGMFPTNKGGKEEKNFIPFMHELEKSGKKPEVIAWSNSTHVHEYCKKHGIESYSKIELTKERFKEKGREHIEIGVLRAKEVADLLEEKIIGKSGFEKVKEIEFVEYYSEPATILGMFMALDMRTALFENTAGLNYGKIISEINNKFFKIIVDPSNDEKIAKSIFNKILNEGFFPEIQKNIEEKANKLLKLSRQFRTIDYSNLSNDELAEFYLQFCIDFMDMRTYSSLPTAMEHKTNLWTELLEKIAKEKIKDDASKNEAFSLLTSPEKSSYLQEFDMELAKAALSNEGPALEDIRQKYEWINYTFEGLPLTAEELKERLKEIGSSQKALKDYLEKNEKRITEIHTKKKQILEKYGFTAEETKLFDIGAEIVFIKYFRKGVFAESYYCMEFLLAEIGKRVGLKKNQVVNMFAEEVLAALKIGEFPGDIVDIRMTQSYMFSDKGRSYPLSINAKEYFKVKGLDTQSKLIKGQTAYPGKVKGKVQIVNEPKDMAGFEEGNILVARSTNPALVPAMKKAAAIVTDIGGLTCHAAIVSRELKTPCIVGTKTATSLLKNGDMIEVDADKGTATKF